MIVRPAIEQHFSQKNNYSPSGKRPRLWASELGGCVRKAMLRVKGYPVTIPFPHTALEAMNDGVVYEHDTVSALIEFYGLDRERHRFGLETTTGLARPMR